MSGSLGQIPLATKGIDPYATQEEIADVAARQAQAGLIGQQATAAGIQNKLALLRLGALAPILGQGVPQPGGGMGAPQGPMLSAPGPTSGAPAASQGAPGLQPVGGYGAVMTPMGVAMPGILAINAMTSTDANAWSSALKARATALSQLLAPVSSAEEYNNALRSAYAAGWITPDDYAQHYQTAGAAPDQWQNYRRLQLRAFQDPDTYANNLMTAWTHGFQPSETTGLPVPSPGAVAGQAALKGAETVAEHAGALPFKGPEAAATAGGTAAGGAPFEKMEVPVLQPDGSTRNVTMTRAEWLRMHGVPTGAGAFGGAAVGSPLAQATQAWEGGAAEAANPNSTAQGPHQWLDDTWRSVLTQHAPAMVAGKTAAQVAAMKNDPVLSAAMFDAYANDNAAKLKADGYDTGNAAIMLAHRYGPAGAEAIMRAYESNPDATLKSVLPAAAASNPQWANASMRQIAADAVSAARAGGVDPAAPYQPPSAQPAAAGGGGPAAGAVGVSVPTLTPQGAAGLKATENMVAADSADVDKSLVAMQEAQLAQSNLLNIRSLIPGITTGSGAPFRQAVANWISTYAPNGADTFVKALTGGVIDPTKTANTQEFVKQTLQQAGTAERQALGARGGYNAIMLYQRAFPNIEMQPTAIRDMTNLMLVANQRDVDYAQGAAGWLKQNRDAFRAPGSTGAYNSVNDYDTQFAKTNTPQVYVAAAAMLNDKPYAQVMKGMSPDEQKLALQVAWRADPGAILIGPDGRKHVNPTLGQ